MPVHIDLSFSTQACLPVLNAFGTGEVRSFGYKGRPFSLKQGYFGRTGRLNNSGSYDQCETYFNTTP
jgi:hypothetical protein